jgi:signal transduction histidine kinase
VSGLRAGLGSLRTRLASTFLAVTLVTVGVVYVVVAPTLGASLRTEKLESLAASARAFSPPIARTIGSDVHHAGEVRAVRAAANRAGTRVTLLAVGSSQVGPPALTVIGDSEGATGDELAPLLALAARAVDGAAGGAATLTGTTDVGGQRTGEAAKALLYRGRAARVVVYSESLGDVQRSVAVVRHRILLAGGIAIVLAFAVGYLVARALSLRVARLEQAARRVAAGDFTGAIPVDSGDELGQLAGALDDMQRQLAELDSARERFIATASHELRTPIFSLGGFLELLHDEDLDADTRRAFLEQIRAQVDRLGQLATGLLDLSRLEAGGLELHSRPADLGVIARTVTAEFTPALAQHASALRLRLRQETIPVVCDPERVAQILRILIDNAIIHTPRGTSIVVTADSGTVSVRDSGEGIPGGELDRIFEPFHTSGGVQGSGLGLAIARELAERMQGRLEVDSSPGRTVFRLVLG